MKTQLIVLAVAVAAVPARAQDLNFGALATTPGAENLVTVTTGVDHAFVAGVGYGRVLSIADHPVVVGGDLTVPWATIDLGDFHLRGGVLAPFGRGRWKVIGGLAASVRGTNDDIARMLGAGIDVAVLAGYYDTHWFAAADLGFDWQLATHITHSDAYRMVYPDARDGWYGNPGGMFHYGIQAGYSFGGNDLIIKAGQLREVNGEPALFPIYGALTYNRRW